MFHNVSALLFALTVKQGNARLSASLSGTLIRDDTGRAAVY